MGEPVLATLAFVAAAVVTLVDGRSAVSISLLAAGLGLAPAVATVEGGTAALLLAGFGAMAALAVPAGHWLARRVSWMPGLHPLVPVVTRPDALFGPRSVRVLSGVLVLPAASWVTFNVPIGHTTTVTGVLFPAALIWGCGTLRLLTARTIADIAIGVGAIALAAAAGWLLTGALHAVPTSGAAAALAPAAALVAGWLSGRHPAAAHPR